MKPFIKTVGVCVLLLLLFVACHKKSSDQPEPEKQKYFAIMDVEPDSLISANPKLVGTKSELESIYDGKNIAIYIQKILDQENAFQALRTRDGSVVVVGSVGPVTDNPDGGGSGGDSGGGTPCRKEINRIYENHADEWQQQANESCEIVEIVQGCPSLEYYSAMDGRMKSPEYGYFTFYPNCIEEVAHRELKKL